MEIDIQQLRQVTIRLLDHLTETHGIKTVRIEQPYYWELPTPESFDIGKEPDKPNVGSLADDWDFLSGLLDSGTDPVAYQLTELAPLIRYLGVKYGRELAYKGG